MRLESRENGVYGVVILGVRGTNHLINVLEEVGYERFFMIKNGDFEDYRFKLHYSEDKRFLKLRITDRLIHEEGIHRTAVFVSGADEEEVQITSENIRKAIGLTPSPKQDVPKDMRESALEDLTKLVATFSE